MAIWSGTGLSGGMVAAGAAATTIVLGVAGYQVFGPDDTVVVQSEAVTTVPVELAAIPEDTAPVEVPATQVVPEITPEIAEITADVAEVTADAPDMIAPRFDLVRVDAAGGAVIAGRAEANADLRLRLDGAEIHVASADGAGGFVAMLSIPRSEMPQVLSLEMVMADGAVMISEQSVIISPARTVTAAEPAETRPMPSGEDTGVTELATNMSAEGAPTQPVAPQLAAPEMPVPTTGASAGDGAETAMAEAENAVDVVAAETTEVVDIPTGAETAEIAEPVLSDDPEIASAETIEIIEEVTEITPEIAPPAMAPSAETAIASAVPEIVAPGEAAEIATPAPAIESASGEISGSGLTSDDLVIASDADAGSDMTDLAAVDTNSALPTASDGASSAGDTTAATSEPTPPVQTPATSEASPDPIVPTVMIADADGIRVVQSGPGPVPQVQVVLDTISYDTSGEVVLTGRGPASSDVRLYLNNQPIQLAQIDVSGGWRTQLPQVDPGTYTLRVDEVSAEGSVLSRVETPFLRETPAVLEALPERDGVAVITVQPGHTLWGIARDQLGGGDLYVQVYEANRDLIRDPHWIYPGQIFAIPDDLRNP